MPSGRQRETTQQKRRGDRASFSAVRIVAAAVILVGICMTVPARADQISDKAAIAQRLQRWAAAFNVHDAAGICNVFAPNLVYTVPGIRSGTRQTLCTHLSTLLTKPGLQLHYDKPDIAEIIIAGELAVVRLFWTLTVRKGTEQASSTEAGVDIFKRQSDGTWSIIRFLSFSLTPNRILE